MVNFVHIFAPNKTQTGCTLAIEAAVLGQGRGGTEKQQNAHVLDGPPRLSH